MELEKVLSHSELHKLGCRLNSGTFGRDTARMSKEEMAAYLTHRAIELHGANATRILEALALSILRAKGSDIPPPEYGSGYGSESGEGKYEGNKGDGEAEASEGETGEGEEEEIPLCSECGEPFNACKCDDALGAENGEGTCYDCGESAEECSCECSECGNLKQECECDEGDDAEGDGSQSESEGDESEGDDAQGSQSESAQGSQSQSKSEKQFDALEARVREIIQEERSEYSQSESESEALQEAKQKLEEFLEEVSSKAKAEEISQRLQEQFDKLAEQVQNAKGNMQSAKIEIQFPNVPAVDLTGKHPLFSRVLALCSLPDSLRPNIMLVGPAGSGKTTLAKQVAEALGLAFGALSLSADMTRGQVEGRVMPLGSGVYVASEFIRLYDAEGNGGLYLFDEIDAASSEVLVTVNAALVNGGAHVEARAVSGLDTFVRKHPRTIIMAAANTYGTGPNSKYVGRSAMDAATLDRFLIIYLDHDFSLWAKIMGADYEEPAPWVPVQRTEEELRAALCEAHNWIRGVAQRVQETQLKRIVSVRSVQRARTCLTAGFSMEDTKAIILAGWKPDERTQVGEEAYA